MTEAVHVHVHSVMGGTFPLRVADLVFTDSALVIPEYQYLTPLFGIARGETQEVTEEAADRYRRDGLPALVSFAERTHRVTYDRVDRVRLYDGGAFGRPKVVADVVSGPPYAYRVHAPVDLDALAGALESLGARREFAVERSPGLGFDPMANARRFLADR